MKEILRSWGVLALSAGLAAACATGTSSNAPPDIVLVLDPSAGMRMVYRGTMALNPSAGKSSSTLERIEEVLRVDDGSLDLQVTGEGRSVIFRVSRSGNVVQMLTPAGIPLDPSGKDGGNELVRLGPQPLIESSLYRAWRVGEKQRSTTNWPKGPDMVVRSTGEWTYRGTEFVMGRLAARFEMSGETVTIYKGNVIEIPSWGDLTPVQLAAHMWLGTVAPTRLQGSFWIDVGTGFPLRMSGRATSAGQTSFFEQLLDLQQSRL